jgi:hypothetical protein
MAKPRTKKRTHVRVNDAATGPGKAGATNRPPKSMVIRMGAGEVGSSVGQLVKDVRAMMEPDTASRLKVRIVSLPFFESNEQLLNAAHTGAKVQQAQRLHLHGRSPRGHTPHALLTLQVQSHKPPHRANTTRTYTTLSD